DGSSLDVHTAAEAMEAEVRRFAGPAEAAGYRALRDWLTRLHRAQMRRFIDTNFDSPFQLLHPDLARLAALGGFGRLDRRIGRFLSDPRLRRVFTFQALYAGLAPARALAAYAVIAYMDTVAGVWFPRGGMHALP
ncbi:phytoene desaturase, partial [Streptomyces sp. SID625]|nr:phytoene desaturase [Streptomyces sp. SID625]